MSESSAAGRSHSGWVKALLIVASFLTVVAIFAAWVQQQALDTSQWVSTSGKLLAKSEVRDALANYAVDQLYENVDVQKEVKNVLPDGNLQDLAGPISSGLREVAVKGAQQILETSRFQSLWQQANQVAHEAFIRVIEDKGQAVSTGGGTVTLRLRPLIIQVADDLGIGADVSSKLPADVGNIKILSSDQLGLAQTIVKLVNGIALATTLIVLALFALAIYLSDGYRWLTVLGVGIGLIVAGVVVLILRSVGGDVVVRDLAADNAQAAGAQVWSVGTSLLRSIAISTITYGVFFILAAWLASPARSATATRRAIAPVMHEYPAVVGGVFGLLALVYVLAGADSTRQFLLRLGLVAMAGAGLVALRNRVIEETPEASLSGVREKVTGHARAVWAKRDRLVPKGREAEAKAGAEPVAAGGEDRRLERLERLASLHERGLLDDEEMAAEKARILSED
ncbi:MAG: SHOCT domain-containing protein [Solirubrobacterales bacterium]